MAHGILRLLRGRTRPREPPGEELAEQVNRILEEIQPKLEALVELADRLLGVEEEPGEEYRVARLTYRHLRGGSLLDGEVQADLD